MPIPKVRKFLGAGYSKLCFALYGKRVALLADDDRIDLEMRLLRRLRKAGVLVLDARVGTVLDEEGKVTRAMIASRYDYHTFDFSGRHLKPKHKENLRKILRVIERNRIIVHDLQFLANTNGDVVVCDPNSITTSRKNKENNTAKEIREILSEGY